MSEQRELTPQELAKIEAETTKLAAETEEKRQLARKASAEADQAEQSAAIAAVLRQQNDELRKKELASNERHHVYTFTGSVDSSSVKACMKKLAEWMREDPKPEAIEIVFTSPGGSIIEGFALFDYIQLVRREGIHVTTSTLGYAASMAGVLLQAGDKRVMAKESWLLIHEASFGASGSFGDVSDTVEWVKRMQDRIVDIYADRGKLSRSTIKKKWARKDWWLSSDEALKHGFVDEIR